jgi:hypothetical protein
MHAYLSGSKKLYRLLAEIIVVALTNRHVPMVAILNKAIRNSFKKRDNNAVLFSPRTKKKR